MNQIGPGIQSKGCHGKMGSQPPRKSVVAIEQTTTMFTYSPRKYRPNRIDEYSVW